MTTDSHLSWWDAARFLWHIRRHPSHVETLWHDSRVDVVRCGACGKTWEPTR